MSANEKAIQEGRSTERFDVSGQIDVINRRTGENIGQLVNISEQGLMILSNNPIPDYSILQLQLSFASNKDSEPMNIGAESLWSNSTNDQNQHWVGFYIIDISDTDLKRIRDMGS